MNSFFYEFINNKESNILKKIGLFVKADAEAGKKADELQLWLQSRGVDVIREISPRPSCKISVKSKSFAPPDLLCVFVLGGDGTFLRAVRWIGDQNIPILGVKFGELGFLAEIAEENLFSAAEYILADRFNINPRMRLQVKVIREGRELVDETALNDIVITKGAFAGLVSIKTYIDDRYLTTYRADGLIISTPTGSTAYSLSAGGPIVHPEVPGIIITPICPFTLTVRPLIVPDSVCMKIEFEEKSSDIILTFDGQAALEINNSDTIIIQKGLHPVNMIMMPDQNYFDVLKAKLRWSGARM
ncbi:MAG: NAD(+)/NADH kinase [Desulfobacterales bacterium]|nr:NAD(+)/NADH kinase [Desulfobacterales bacterium]